MSGNRPSLAGAFAPVTPRGARLEGMLAPKRKRFDETPIDSNAAPPVEQTHLAIAPNPPADLEPVEARTPIAGGGKESEEVADPPKTAEPLDTESSRITKSQKTTKKRAKSGGKISESVPGAPRNVGVYLAPELLAVVKETVHLQRITYADLLLDAFDALDEDDISREFRPENVPSSSGMPRRAVRRRGSAGIQIQVRLDDEQIAWLDEKVVEFGAPSRSALVSTAYKLHLARK